MSLGELGRTLFISVPALIALCVAKSSASVKSTLFNSRRARQACGGEIDRRKNRSLSLQAHRCVCVNQLSESVYVLEAVDGENVNSLPVLRSHTAMYSALEKLARHALKKRTVPIDANNGPFPPIKICRAVAIEKAAKEGADQGRRHRGHSDDVGFVLNDAPLSERSTQRNAAERQSAKREILTRVVVVFYRLISPNIPFEQVKQERIFFGKRDGQLASDDRAIGNNESKPISLLVKVKHVKERVIESILDWTVSSHLGNSALKADGGQVWL